MLAEEQLPPRQVYTGLGIWLAEERRDRSPRLRFAHRLLGETRADLEFGTAEGGAGVVEAHLATRQRGRKAGIIHLALHGGEVARRLR